MKKKLFLALFSLTSTTAFAGYNFPMTSEGDIQVTHAHRTISEIFDATKESLLEALKSRCENSPQMIGSGAFSRVTSINLDPVMKKDSSGGDTIHFVVFGRCEIP